MMMYEMFHFKHVKICYNKNMYDLSKNNNMPNLLCEKYKLR